MEIGDIVKLNGFNNILDGRIGYILDVTPYNDYVIVLNDSITRIHCRFRYLQKITLKKRLLSLWR